MPINGLPKEAALEVLLETRAEQQAVVSERLVREVYDVEFRLQFDGERGPALAALRAAVNAEVEREIEENGTSE